jgi:indole-3-glycerol phosphate synthase
MTILDDIRDHKERELADRKGRRPLSDLVAACESAPPARGFGEALRRPGLQLIAEVKRRSPAKGDLAPDADAPRLAETYLSGGAAAVSVLTDEHFFSGADADLQAVRARVDGPLLRKDFVISTYQIYEACLLGADAVLLIVSMLTDEQLRTFLDTADALGMDALVETHTEDEVRRAVGLNAQIIGINNRDLSTFTVDLGTTERLRHLVPDPIVVVSESGISRREDVARVQAAGAKAILVGEALVTAPDARARIAELLARESPVVPTP